GWAGVGGGTGRRASDGARPVVAFTPLGLARRGLVEVPDPPTASRRGDDQMSAEGGRLFLARLPSLGYATEDRARTALAAADRVSLEVTSDGTSAVLQNADLRATVRHETGWGPVSLVDYRSRQELIPAVAAGHDFV